METRSQVTNWVPYLFCRKVENLLCVTVLQSCPSLLQQHGVFPKPVFLKPQSLHNCYSEKFHLARWLIQSLFYQYRFSISLQILQKTKCRLYFVQPRRNRRVKTKTLVWPNMLICVRNAFLESFALHRPARSELVPSVEHKFRPAGLWCNFKHAPTYARDKEITQLFRAWINEWIAV